jgi:tetratricopeptide (TPR) repeat protein
MSVGTPAYMSPEQASGERDIDGRSDLYSLGLVGYEMLAGAPPFTGRTSASVIMKQITEQPAPLVSKAADVPPALAAVIERSLAKSPDDRWPDGEAMGRAIAAVAMGLDPASAIAAPSSPSTGAGPGRPGRRRVPAAILAIIALVIIAPLAFLVFRGRSGVPSGVDPRKSFLVVPFRVQGGDPSLAWLRDGSVSMLALNLAQWRDISVVEYERSLDLLRDAKLDGVAEISLEQAQDLAKRAGAWTLVTGSITRIGDSLNVAARLWAVESGQSIGKPAEIHAPATADPRRLFDQLANQLLGVVGAKPVELELAKATTGSVDAYRNYLIGVRALNEWRLTTADSALGAAVAVDSTFALAWYKRSLASGWRRANDTNTVNYARRALTHAARLPSRERGLVEGNFEQQQQNWAAARARYLELLKSDSTDAEAWYALADAYYHDQTRETRAANLTASLAAFTRTLALDSTFHLAYSHRVDLYSDASRAGSSMLIVNDTVRVLTSADVQRLGRAYIDSVRRGTRALAISNAQQWVYTDEDAAPAYFSLAEAHAASGDFVKAAETLERAMARPTTRMADFPYRIASYQLGAGSPNAIETLRKALREQTADSLRHRSTARRFNILVGSANVALATGAMGDLVRVFERLFEVDPNLPGTQRSGRPVPTSVAFGPFRAALTAGMNTDTRNAAAEIRATVKELEAIPGPVGDQVRQQSAQIAYAGFMVSRDTFYLALIRKWSGRPPTPALLAVAALEAGDTAGAARIAQQFRGSDADGSGQDAASEMIEGEVLTRLGELPRALATLERINPKNFAILDLDPRWAFYPRTLIQRGEIHERLGQPERADSLYSQAVELLKNADAEGRSVLESAQQHLAALRDRPKTVPLGRPPR